MVCVMQRDIEPIILRKSEAAALLGYSVRRFSDLVAQGVIPGATVGVGNARRWDREALIAWKDAGGSPRRREDGAA